VSWALAKSKPKMTATIEEVVEMYKPAEMAALYFEKFLSERSSKILINRTIHNGK
jgi:hypothetical protein